MAVASHIIAGISGGIRHRHSLAAVLTGTPADTCITTLLPEELYRAGVRALALDFDGVLAPHGAPEPLPSSVEWLHHCEAVFGPGMLFILSNKPTERRRLWFAEHFPAICFISGVRKKPYPDGINKAGELAGVPPSSVLMVDDRLLTGCLAALNAGARPCYIRRPEISFSGRPAAELFFFLLRCTERLSVSAVSII